MQSLGLAIKQLTHFEYGHLHQKNPPSPLFKGELAARALHMFVIHIMSFVDNHTVLLPLEKGAGGIF